MNIKNLFKRCTNTLTKKIICIAAAVLLVAAPFVIYTVVFSLSHEYLPATCTAPQQCTHCDKTIGDPLGHNWSQATCTAPKTCSVCKETEGELLPHQYKEATCTTPKTCADCGATEGKPAAHTWKEATCTAPKTCSVCKATEGAVLDHSYQQISRKEPTCDAAGSVVYKCKGCGKKSTTTLAKKEHIVLGGFPCTQTAKCLNCGQALPDKRGRHSLNRLNGCCFWCHKYLGNDYSDYY